MGGIYAVIMAGGSGKRFWPASRRLRPKQLLQIIDDGTMLQATVARLAPLIPAERILVVTTAELADETRRQLPQIAADRVIPEPVGRDTAPCVCLAALLVERLDPDATMILLPADHIIRPADAFQSALAAGIDVARDGGLVTYGIIPRHAATGYGYIELAAARAPVAGVAVHQAARFVEKPDAAAAEHYLATGRFRWNSGIFTWRVEVVLRELERQRPALVAALRPVQAAWGTAAAAAALGRIYPGLERISIDYALMEHAPDIRVVTGSFAWDDLGSWDALAEYGADRDGNLLRGDTELEDCRDSLVYALGRQVVAGIGLDHLVVVATDDAVLVCDRHRSQEIKAIVDRLAARGRADLL
jgi:mannose-1-phosphate guanylyltransferase